MASLRDVILEGDVLQRLPEIPDESVDCVVTSPPYWALRDYGVDGQLGLEPTWREHLRALLPVFAHLKRVMKPGANLFVNYGDTVAQGKPDPEKHKLGLHWRLRFLLNDELGFISRSDIVWHKPNQMPLSAKDRMTPKYEMVFHFTKKPRYFSDIDAIRTPLAEKSLTHRGGGSAAGSLATTDDLGRVASGNLAAWSAPKKNAFNLRVRDVKEGRADEKWGSLGVRRADAEVAAYAERAPPAARREKTLGHDGTPGDPGLRLAPEPGDPGLRLAPEPGEPGAFHPLGANPGDVWSIASQRLEEAHFATFPEELVRRLIAFGSPTKVCGDCGAPWTPKNETEFIPQVGISPEALDRDPEAMDENAPMAGLPRGNISVKVLPPEPSCACRAMYTGATVLDPFLGSGTTALVAKRLGRFFIGVEINPEYVAIARRRIAPAMNRRLDA